MDHVASGWNGRKSNNIFVPDEEFNGVSVFMGDLYVFWPILAIVVSRGAYTRLRIRGDDGRGWIQDFLFRDFF